ncbi:MAG: glycosyltransferase family 39 protein [Deltaproteobacteria bacterium]|nr:glycosyltransferase family 39 protein [Deltaproteobacteria bacterium]
MTENPATYAPESGCLKGVWNSWQPYACLFGLALLIRLAFLWQARDYPLFYIPIGDAEGYDLWAQKIAAGNALGDSVFYQAPLYPYFLGLIYSIFGRDLVIVRIFQALLDSSSCILFALAGRRFFNRPSGLAAGLLLAFYPMSLFFVLVMQKAALTVFCLGLFLYFLGEALYGPRPRLDWLLCGAGLGLLALVRENALAFIPLAAAWFLVSEKFNRAARIRVLAFLLGLFLVLFPVALRNLIVGDTFALTTSQFGANFYYGNNRAATGLYEPLKWGRSSWRYEQEDARQLAEKALGRKLSPSEISHYWTKKALAEIAENPKGWLFRSFGKWLLLWNRVEVADSEDVATLGLFSGVLQASGALIPFGVLCPLAAFGLALSLGNIRRHGIILILLFTYALSVAAFFIFDRYRLPLAAFLCLYAGFGLYEGFRLLRERRKKPLAWALGSALAAVFVVMVPLVPEGIMSANTAFNIGTVIGEKGGDRAESMKWYQRAIEENPAHVKARMAMADELLRQNRADEALGHLYEAIRFKPGLASAHRLLARITARTGRAEASTAHYLALLEQEPGNAEAMKAVRSALAEDGGPGRVRKLAEMAFVDPKRYQAIEKALMSGP